jgi:hypothetical protein
MKLNKINKWKPEKIRNVSVWCHFWIQMPLFSGLVIYLCNQYLLLLVFVCWIPVYGKVYLMQSYVKGLSMTYWRRSVASIILHFPPPTKLKVASNTDIPNFFRFPFVYNGIWIQNEYIKFTKSRTKLASTCLHHKQESQLLVVVNNDCIHKCKSNCHNLVG